MRTSIVKHTWRTGALLLVIVASGYWSVALGQNFPEESVRTELVTALNSWFSTVNQVGTQTFTFTPSGSQEMFTYDPIASLDANGCYGETSFQFNVEFDGSYFTINRTMPTPQAAGGPDWRNHEMVTDLNSWLNSVWGLPLNDIPIFESYGWTCGTSGYRFYTLETTDQGAIDAVIEATGEQRMLDKYYLLNGVYRKGSDIFTFTPPAPAQRKVRYLTDRGDPTDLSTQTQVRYLGNAYLEIELHDGDNTPEFVFEISMQTTPYPVTPQACGISVYEATAASANNGVDVSIDILNQATTCKFGWFWNTTADPTSSDGPVYGEQMDGPTDEPGYFRSPDSASKRLFRYIRNHRGEWRVNPGPSVVGQQRGFKQLGGFYMTAAGELAFVRHWSGCCEDDERAVLGSIESDEPQPTEELCKSTYCTGGEFFLDEKYKMLYYASPDNGCWIREAQDVAVPTSVTSTYHPIAVPCIPFCDSIEPDPKTVNLVTRSSARLFSDRIATVPLHEYESRAWIYPTASECADDFERGLRGKWRVEKNFVFRSDILGGTKLFDANPPTSLQRNYADAGTYDLTYFSPDYSDANLQSYGWVNPTTVLRYSANGEPVEEESIVDIVSTAHYGYHEQLPTLVAANASYASVLFVSFEDDESEELDNQIAHSGYKSLPILKQFDGDPGSNDYTEEGSGHRIGTIVIDNYSLGVDQPAPDPPCAGNECMGLLVRFWATPFYDVSDGLGPLVIPEPRSPVVFEFVIDQTLRKIVNVSEMSFVAKTGEWGLFEFVIEDFDATHLLLSADVYAYGSYLANAADPTVHIDDVRIQPVQSEMSCYVYDPVNYRLAAQFDDQHFATYFQYNGEGSLVRQIRETERGMRTLLEVHANRPLVQRSYGSSTVAYSALPVVADYDDLTLPMAVNERGGADVGILGLSISADSVDFSVLGLSRSEINSVLEAWGSDTTLVSLMQNSLDESVKVAMVRDAAQIQQDIDSLSLRLGANVEDSAEVEEQVEVLRARLQRIESQLGIDTDQLSRAGGVLNRIGDLHD